MNNIPRPMFLHRVFQAIAFVGAIPFVVNTFDVLLNPAVIPMGGMQSYRPIAGLLLAPLTLLIAILCVRRAPKNLIGWMLVTFAYGVSSQAMRRDLLPVTPTLLIANAFISLFWFSYLLIPLYFPNGYLHPPRLNRWGNPLIAVMMVVMFLLPNLFNRNITYGTSENTLSAPNPFFVTEFDYTVITFPVGILGFIGLGLVTLILRYRSSGELERLQLRWLLAGVIVQSALTFSLDWIESLGIDTTLFSTMYALTIPIAIGIAILRYRLYDIDIIIRRTLIYSILSGILAVIYFGGVVVAQQVFRAATGETPDIAIVMSTLLIATLFTPLRRRIQATIDRRLYRRKYDAEQTLARFNQTLREEVNLEDLKASLVGVVQETMQPRRVALWVKEES